MATEKRLISYDALIAHLDSCIEQSKGLFKSVCVAIKCFVEQMPTVDAVEVVRCKDCKWYKIAPFDNVPYCSHESGYCGEHMGGLFYCANGERKDNEV